MSDSDLEALEGHLDAERIDVAVALAERLGSRYNDYRVRRCAPEILRELALTLGQHAVEASVRRKPADARRLLSLAQSLCKKSGPECRAELHELERDLRPPR
jgi:hypothetical protein